MVHHVLKLGLLTGLLMSGCTHFSSEENPQVVMDSKKKKKSGGGPDEPASPEHAPTYSEESALYLRVSDLQTSLAIGDVQVLRRIAGSVERSPLGRACLVFGLLRAYLHQGMDPVIIDQAALTERTPTQVKNWASFNSLEDLFKDANLNFKEEIANNPFLQNISAVDLSLRALEKDQDKTSPFITEVRTELDAKSSQWVKVREKYAPPPPAPAVPVNPDQPVDISKQVAPPPEAPLDLSAVRETSEVVKKASELEEKNRFDDALQLLRNAKPQTPEVKIKIRSVANKAVSELRTKAARSYQSAVPIQDLQARSKYLIEARDYLQKAVDAYPESDQIDAVKQNLATIEKNIKVLK